MIFYSPLYVSMLLKKIQDFSRFWKHKEQNPGIFQVWGTEIQIPGIFQVFLEFQVEWPPWYRNLSRKELKWINKPWINHRLQRIIAKKNKLYHKYIKHRDPFWYNHYSALKKNLKQLLIDAKNAYSIKFFKQNAENSRKIWSGINKLIFNNNKAKTQNIFLNDEGSIVTDQKSVATKFNNFYTNMANKLLENMGETNIFRDGTE